MGGYGVGGGAYWVAENFTVSDGDKLEYGQRGTVVGPATAESVKGKGVSVQFPGNKGVVSCYFDQVRRSPLEPASPAPRPRPAAPLLTRLC